ncbi:MAG: chorismate-binding protein, partial [Flavobacteriaceae bacterium]|nr:chorismate-binding protein [Flavobacteriaceae bacterium]
AKDYKKVVWSPKEQIEQQMVTDFIVDELKSAIQNLTISNPTSVKAGHLWHIKTDIEGEISAESSLEKIIQKLHPTPAVCGFPKNLAKDFILSNEAYNREFYTGFLGEININLTTELFVNLRCMQVENNTISIFVGGGITKDSNPEKEWEETVAKAKTMKNVLL